MPLKGLVFYIKEKLYLV